MRLSFGRASVLLIVQCFLVIAKVPATTSSMDDESSTAAKALFEDDVTAEAVVKGERMARRHLNSAYPTISLQL